jgi:hypothetical protein
VTLYTEKGPFGYAVKIKSTSSFLHSSVERSNTRCQASPEKEKIQTRIQNTDANFHTVSFKTVRYVRLHEYAASSGTGPGAHSTGDWVSPRTGSTRWRTEVIAYADNRKA